MSKRKGVSASKSKSKHEASKPTPAKTSSSQPPPQTAPPASDSGVLVMGSARSRERLAERKQQKRRQQQLAIAASFFIIAIIGVVVAIIINQPAEAPIPDGTVERYEGLTVSNTEKGYPRLGEAQGTVRVVEFSSFSCPACREFHDTVFPSLLDRVKRGEISFTFVPLTTGSIPNAPGAARAALCAAEQRAFWPFHDSLFNWHGVYGNQAFSQNRLTSGVRNLLLDVNLYDSCIRSERPNQIMDAAQTDAEALEGGVQTPTITIDGVAQPSVSLDAINNAINQRLLARGITSNTQPGITPAEITPEVEPRPTRTETSED